MSTNETTADLWSSSTANSPDKARVYRATIAPLDQPDVRIRNFQGRVISIVSNLSDSTTLIRKPRTST